MATPRSTRLSDDVLRRSSAFAARRDASVASVIERLLDEALRRELHPAVTFRDGPSGRRAGLVAGPDVDEVIRGLRAVQAQGEDDPVEAVASAMSLTPDQVRAAAAYYADHPSEVDARMPLDEQAADELEAARRWPPAACAGSDAFGVTRADVAVQRAARRRGSRTSRRPS